MLISIDGKIFYFLFLLIITSVQGQDLNLQQGQDLLQQGQDLLNQQGQDLLQQGQDLLNQQGQDLLNQQGQDLLNQGQDLLNQQGQDLLQQGQDLLNQQGQDLLQQGQDLLNQQGKDLLQQGQDLLNQKGKDLLQQGQDLLNQQGQDLLQQGQDLLNEQGKDLLQQGQDLLNEQGKDLLQQGQDLLNSHGKDLQQRNDLLNGQGQETADSIPRIDFTCPTTCPAGCLTTRDSSCLFIVKFDQLDLPQDSLIDKSIVQTAFDNHITCKDGVKLFKFLTNLPTKEKDGFVTFVKMLHATFMMMNSTNIYSNEMENYPDMNANEIENHPGMNSTGMENYPGINSTEMKNYQEMVNNPDMNSNGMESNPDMNSNGMESNPDMNSNGMESNPDNSDGRNISESSGSVQQFFPVLRFLKDSFLRYLMVAFTSQINKDTVQICNQLNYLDCRVQNFFLKKVFILDFCRRLVQNFNPDINMIRNFLIDKHGDLKTWTHDKWVEIMPYMEVMQQSPEFLSAFPADLLFSLMLNGSVNCQDIKLRQVRMAIQDKLSKVLEENKQNSTISGAAVRFLQQCGGSIKEMEKYVTKKQILETFDSSTAVVSKREKAAMKKILKTEIPDPAQFSKEEIVRYFALISNDRRMLDSLNKTALAAALCDIGGQVTDMKEATKLKSVLVKLEGYNDLTTYTTEQLRCLKNLLGTLSPRQIDEIPTAALGNLTTEGSLASVKFSCPVASAVLKKYLTFKNSDLTAADFLKLPGSVQVCLRPVDLEHIPSEEITLNFVNGMIEQYKKAERTAPAALIRTLVKKVTNNDVIAELAKTSLGKYIPTAVLRKSVNMGQQIADELKSGEVMSIKADCKKAKLFYKELTSVIGPVSTSNYNWTTAVFKALEDTNILSGIPLSDLIQVDDSQMYDIANSFLASKCITGSQKKIIMRKFMAAQPDTSTGTAITAEDIQNMDPTILFNQKVEDLEKYGEENKNLICTKIGQIDIQQVQMHTLLKKASFCPQCSNAASFTNEDVTNCGALMCALPESSIDKIDGDALVENAAKLAVNCQWDQQQRKKLIEVAQQKGVVNAAGSMTEEDLMTLKTLIADLSPEEFAQIPTVAFEMADTGIVEAFKERKLMLKERLQKGFRNLLSTEEELKQKEGTLQVFRKIIEMKLSGTGRRKKRATGSLTCDELTTLDTVGLPLLTVENFNGINNVDFQDCLQLLGQVTEWSTAQKAALAAKMSSIYGSVSNWTLETVGKAGSVLQGLSAGDIEDLQIDQNIVSSLGALSGWSSEQAQAVYNKYMSSVKSGGLPSSLGSADIMALANFLCGMTSAQIENITPSVYKEAADTVGAVTSCSEPSRLQSWSTLATHTNGFGSDISVWDGSTMSSVGLVIAGLSAQNIASLSAGQIDSIDSNHISFFPNATLKSFTDKQFGNFSSAQALATSKEQRAWLTCDQYNALEGSAGIQFGDAARTECIKTGGAEAGSKFSMILFVTVLATTSVIWIE